MKRFMTTHHCIRRIFGALALLVWVGACAEAEKTGGTAPSKGAIVVTSDFKDSGTVALLSLGADPAAWSLSDNLELVSSDAVVRAFGPRVYVINRLQADNIQVLDPNNNYRTSAQFSVGNGANPYDILEVSPGKAYVTRYEPPYDDILIVHPSTGEHIGSIPLGSVPGLNKTGTPRADALVMLNGSVYVLLQNLDSSFTEVGSGLLVSIDPKTDGVTDTIDLGVKNPGSSAVHDGELYIVALGDFLAADPAATSGIVAFNPRTRTVRTVAAGNALGGRPGDLAITKSGQGYLSVSDLAWPPTFNPIVVTFDPVSGAIGPAVYTGSSNGSSLSQMELDSFGFLHLLDRDPERPGIVVLDTKTQTVVQDRFQTSLAPASIAIVSEE